MDDTKAVGEKLVEFCRNGLNLDAIASLYSPDIVSVEAIGSDGVPAEMRGVDAVVAKNKRWYDNNEIHHASAEGPYPHRDRFAVIFHYETTAKDGPRKGQRSKFDEVALYTVKDGRIVREEFFYDMG
ncbi:MAG: nuclear transport factor 2 family protein [Acidobacteriota bacterium]